MKKYLLLLTILICHSLLHAQFTWKGATNFSCCTSINGFAFDNAGNIFVTGTFYGDTYVGPYYLVSATPFHYNSYIAKMSPAGTILWAKTIGSNGSSYSKRLCTDKSGNVFVTGSFATNLVYGLDTLSSSDGNDAFIMKVNAGGHLVWWIHPVGSGNEVFDDVATDSAGNAYCVGTYNDFADFGNYALGTTYGTNNLMIVEFQSNNGKVLRLANSLTQNAATNCHGARIAVDKAGANIYAIGDYGAGACKFGTFTLTAPNPYGNFMVKLGSATKGSLTYYAATDIGDIPNGYVNNIVMDAANNIYLSGNFGAFTPFQATIGGTTITSSGNSDVFIAKYNSNFALQWLKQGGSTVSGDFAFDMVAAQNGNVYVAFTGGASVSFGSVTATTAHPGANDIGIVKYNTAGTPKWASVSGGINYDAVYAIDYFENKHIVAIAGLNGANAYFGNYQVAAAGGFIAGLADAGSAINTDNIISGADNIPGIKIYPVPAHQYITIDGLKGKGDLFLYTMQGKLALTRSFDQSSVTFDIKTLAKGNYELQIISGEQKISKNIVVQ